jgi:hypothetical protein
MALSSENAKTIGLIADKFDKWAENLSYEVRPAGNLWVELTLSLYPHNVHNIASWLAKIPTTGQKVGEALEELSELVLKIDAWRYQGVYPEDLGDFCACVNRLIKVTRNTVSLLRDISGSDEQEPSETKAAAVTEEKSNSSEIQEIKPAPVDPLCAAVKSLPKEALTAYKLHYEMGLTIQQVARQMTKQLKLDKALRPFQVSRWIKQIESQRKRMQVPIRSIAPKASETTARSESDATKT